MQPFKLKIETSIDRQRLRDALCYHAAVFAEPIPKSKRGYSFASPANDPCVRGQSVGVLAGFTDRG